MTDSPSMPPDDSGRPQDLGTILRTSRERKGLELDDVAEVTHVRKEYLRALEEGRYADLPEDVYARNFLRLYAQAVGLEGEKLLDMFTRERTGGRIVRTGPGAADGTAGARAEPARRQPAPQPAARAPRQPDPSQPSAAATAAPVRPARPQNQPRNTEPRAARAFGGAGRQVALPRLRIGSLVATVLLVAAIVAVALWAFNNQLFDAGRTPTAAAPPADEGGLAVPPAADGEVPIVPPGSPEDTEQARDVLLTVESEPAGAEVTVDGFPLPGVTPVQDVPVTARASRQVRVTLDGYEPFESTYDLSFDRTLSVILQPQAPEPAAAVAGGETPAEGPPPTAGSGQIALNVTEPTWLEVYSGTARGQGSRLVYTTAQPGDRFMFDLPVYVHVGNAAGLHVSVNGQDIGNFGSSGAVVGRAFTP